MVRGIEDRRRLIYVVYRKKAYRCIYEGGTQAAKIVASVPAPDGKIGAGYFKFKYLDGKDIDGSGKEEVLNIKSFQKERREPPPPKSPSSTLRSPRSNPVSILKSAQKSVQKAVGLKSKCVLSVHLHPVN